MSKMDEFGMGRLVTVLDNHAAQIALLRQEVKALQGDNASLTAIMVEQRTKIRDLEAQLATPKELPKAEPLHRGAARSTRKGDK